MRSICSGNALQAVPRYLRQSELVRFLLDHPWNGYVGGYATFYATAQRQSGGYAEIMQAIANHRFGKISYVIRHREEAPQIPVLSPAEIKFFTSPHWTCRKDPHALVTFTTHDGGWCQYEVPFEKGPHEIMTLNNAILPVGQLDFCLLSVLDFGSWTVGVTHLRMFFYELNVSFQCVWPAQVIISGNDPHIFAAA